MSETRQRLIALALLGMVLAAATFGAVLPALHAYRARAEAIGDRVFHLEHFERVASRAASIHRALRRLEADGTIDHETFAEPAAALAAARLQERIRKAISHAGGKLLSTRVLPDAGAGPFNRVAVDVRMRVGFEGLQRVLYALESGAPLVRVDGLEVRSSRAARPLRAPRASHDRLDVRFEAEGFRHAADEPTTGG